METISAKGVLYALLPILVLVQLSSPTEAVDIIFYAHIYECNGPGLSFNNIGPRICCALNSPAAAGAVLVTDTIGPYQISRFYAHGDCNTQVETGYGNFCLVGGQYFGGYPGASWVYSQRRLLLDDALTCDTQTSKPTGVVYSEDSTKGHWILRTSEAAEMFAQMQKFPDAEKISWLQSHNASYKAL